MDDNGNATEYFHDLASRLTQVRYQLTDGETQRNLLDYEYDLNGNVTKVSATEVNTLTHGVKTHGWDHAYDELDRLKATTYKGHDAGGPDPVTQVLAFDSRGFVVTKQDENGTRTSFTHDGLGRRTQTVLNAGGTSPAPITLATAYDLASNVTSRTDGKGGSTTYEYDQQNRLTRTTLPGGNWRSLAYNDLGLVQTESDSKGSTVSYRYNHRGLLFRKDVTFLTGTLQTTFEEFEYDGAYRLTRARDDDTDVRFTYNGEDQLVTETLNILTYSRTGVITHAWDDVGRRTGVTYPVTGTQWSFTHDRLDRVKEVRRGADLMVRHYYEGAGSKRVRKERALNLQTQAPIWTHYSYDALDRGTEVNHGRLLTALRWHSYGWGNGTGGSKYFSRATEYMYDGGATLTRTYAYDNAYRLTQATKNAQTWTFNIDAGQARTSMLAPAEQVTYTVNSANQVTQSQGTVSGTTTFGYDQSGNQITKGGQTFAYNYRDQLVSASDPIQYGLVLKHRYDALGRRVVEERVQGSPVVKCFFYDGWNIAVETDQNGVAQRETLYGPGTDEIEYSKVLSPLAHGFPLQDALGTVHAVANESGTITSSFDYGPYGETTATGSAFPYGYTGRRYLPDFKLYDYRNRFYDPQTGRFIHRDPLGIWGDGIGLGNGYAYVGNNPANLIDPSGLGFWDVFGRIAQGVGGVLEMGIGLAATVASGGAGAAVGVAAYLHGLDNLVGAITGESTVTSHLIASGAEALGASPETAQTVGNVGDGVIGIALTAGAGSIAKGAGGARAAPKGPGSAADDVAEGAAKKGKEGIDEAAEKSGKEGAEQCADDATEAGDDVAEAADDAAKGAEDAAQPKWEVATVTKEVIFLEQSGKSGFWTKVDSNGTLRKYDPTTNTFASYNADGTTRTFYKPNPAKHGYPTNLDYWNAQPGW